MNTDSFIVHLKTDGNYKNIGKDVETRFRTSNYEFNRTLTKGKNKKVISVMKDKLGRKIMKEFAGMGLITHTYLIDDGSKDIKAKGEKTCVNKRKLNFIKTVQKQINHLKEENKTDADSFKKDHIEFIKNKQLILNSQQRFISKKLNVFTDEGDKIALKVQSSKLYDKKHMIGSTQITNTKMFIFIAVLVVRLLSQKVLFKSRKDNRNC